MRINAKLVKAVQKIWNRDWVNPGLNLDLTDDEAKCLTKTLIQWNVYHNGVCMNESIHDTLNQNNQEKKQ